MTLVHYIYVFLLRRFDPFSATALLIEYFGQQINETNTTKTYHAILKNFHNDFFWVPYKHFEKVAERKPNHKAYLANSKASDLKASSNTAFMLLTQMLSLEIFRLLLLWLTVVALNLPSAPLLHIIFLFKRHVVMSLCG